MAPPRIRGRGFINGSDTKLKAGDRFFFFFGGEGLRGEFGPMQEPHPFRKPLERDRLAGYVTPPPPTFC